MKIPTAKKLPSGNWNVSVMIDGRRVSVTAPTKKEAERKAAEIKASGKVQARPGNITLCDAISAYIDSRGVLSPATLRGYNTIKRTRFKELMERNIYSITRQDLQRAVNVEVKKVSAKTVKNAFGLIHKVLKEYGIDASGVQLPQAVKPVKQYLQPEDIGKLVEAVEGDTCEIPILLAVWLGMRRSEICGLCWDCVDTENSVIHVRRSVVPDASNKFVLKDTPKNSFSQRTIDCPEYIMDKIKQLPRREGGRLFAMYPNTITVHIHKACKRAGITDTTTHGLRHTNAAVMKTIGIDDRHAMERGGWSCESTYRKTYSYVFESKKVEADTAINGFFNAQVSGRNKIADEITDKK
jgi:integrase